MFKNKFIALFVSVLVTVALGACNLTGAPVVTSEPSQAAGVSVETLVAEALTSTTAAQATVANALAATQTAMATPTPEFTFTPSLTPTATFTITPSVPMVSVSVATYCRSGPTTAYDILGVLNVGQTAQVVGRSTLSDTMIIRLPSNPSITCWLWAQNATVVGDTSGLPLINVPPTPTPAPTAQAAFNVSYSSTANCSGEYELKFMITNTGGTTWESNRIRATDQVTGEVQVISHDDFPDRNKSCSLSSDDQNLESGEVGYSMSGGFSANPAGHSFQAVIRVCSEDGMNGTCLAETITFTP